MIQGSLASNQFGKIPPQAISVEEIVLGSILLDKNAFSEIVGFIQSETFYKDSNQKIFESCKKLYDSHEPIDLTTVINQLKKDNALDVVGGPFAISQLTNNVASTTNIKSHAMIIAQMFAKREAIRICSEGIKSAFEDSSDPFVIFEELDKEIQDVKNKILGASHDKEWSDQVNDVVSVIERLQKSELKVSGIPTGNKKLDAITGGWQKSDLIIIAARPSIGKTTRAINFIKAACLYGHKTIMFSLEMDYRQLARKFLNDESEIYGNKLISGDLQDYQIERLKRAKDKLIQLPFHINDKGSISPSYVRNVLKQRTKKHGVDFVVIDYVGLMKPSDSMRNRSRDNELGTITASIKSIAKEFDIPIILLSQLNRKCEERIDKRPMLSDLRESGNIEQDADLVMGLYRPSYYHVYDKPDRDYQKDIAAGMSEEQYNRISELSILKHRNGATDRFIKESFYGEFSRFTSDDSDVPAPQIENVF